MKRHDERKERDEGGMVRVMGWRRGYKEVEYSYGKCCCCMTSLGPLPGWANCAAEPCFNNTVQFTVYCTVFFFGRMSHV